MKLLGRKVLCSIAFFLIVFHLLFPISFDVTTNENAETAFSRTGVFVWEFFQPRAETTKISGESSRYYFQSIREKLQKTIPVGMPQGVALKTQLVKVRQYWSIGIVVSMIFLTIIIYIYQSDGKKRNVM